MSNKFQAWKDELDELFINHFGLCHDDFEDYNWSDEYNSEVPPEDAFDEWKIHTENGTISPTAF